MPIKKSKKAKRSGPKRKRTGRSSKKISVQVHNNVQSGGGGGGGGAGGGGSSSSSAAVPSSLAQAIPPPRAWMPSAPYFPIGAEVDSVRTNNRVFEDLTRAAQHMPPLKQEEEEPEIPSDGRPAPPSDFTFDPFQPPYSGRTVKEEDRFLKPEPSPLTFMDLAGGGAAETSGGLGRFFGTMDLDDDDGIEVVPPPPRVVHELEGDMDLGDLAQPDAPIGDGVPRDGAQTPPVPPVIHLDVAPRMAENALVAPTLMQPTPSPDVALPGGSVEPYLQYGEIHPEVGVKRSIELISRKGAVPDVPLLTDGGGHYRDPTLPSKLHETTQLNNDSMYDQFHERLFPYHAGKQVKGNEHEKFHASLYGFEPDEEG